MVLDETAFGCERSSERHRSAWIDRRVKRRTGSGDLSSPQQVRAGGLGMSARTRRQAPADTRSTFRPWRGRRL